MAYYKLEYEDISSKIFSSLDEAREYRKIFASKFKEENPLIQIVHLQDYYKPNNNNFFMFENAMYSYDCIFKILTTKENDKYILRVYFKDRSHVEYTGFNSSDELKEFCLENNIPYQVNKIKE